jgi:hypothetical protein
MHVTGSGAVNLAGEANVVMQFFSVFLSLIYLELLQRQRFAVGANLAAAMASGSRATMRRTQDVGESARGASRTWIAPAVRVHSIGELTRLGFNTNCDGGIATNVIDGTAIGCN